MRSRVKTVRVFVAFCGGFSVTGARGLVLAAFEMMLELLTQHALASAVLVVFGTGRDSNRPTPPRYAHA